MVTISLIAIFLIQTFANSDNNQTLIYQHPIWKFDDPAINDSNTELGICYGSSTQWAAYPYIVQTRGSCGCTGSIIDMGNSGLGRPATILTAAHCRNCISTVYVGCNNPSNCAGSPSYSAATNTFTEWGYENPNRFSNDIAIFQLTTAITQPSSARAVELNNNVNANSNVNRVTGYGIDQTRSTPTALQTGITTFVPQSTCNSRMSGVTIEDNMICVQDPSNSPSNPGVSVCSGDSGGPWTGSDGKQYGVTSFGQAALVGGCGVYECRCCPDSPQVGANVAHFINQICSAIGNNNPGC